MTVRRAVLTSGLALPLAMPAQAAARPAVVWELTFLKALDSDPADLIVFIKANRFVMDRIAAERELFSDFALYRATDEGDLQVAVVVGYPDPRSHDGVRTEFEAIRAAQVAVPINGRTLGDLGRVIGTRRVEQAQVTGPAFRRRGAIRQPPVRSHPARNPVNRGRRALARQR